MSVDQINVKLDAKHFGTIHHQYRDRLLDSMTGLVKDRQVAEEITATAFSKAFEKRSSFRGESSPYTWLYAIGLNEAREYWAKNRAVPLESLTGTEPQALVECDSVADKLELLEDRLKLARALCQIPAVHRRALVDHFVRGYSVKEISRRIKIPVGTVLSRIFKAKRLVRAAWEA